MAWVAALLALFALLRALRRVVETDQRPLALLVSVAVVALAAALPTTLGQGRATAEQAGWRKGLQLLAAAAVTALAALLGAGVVLAGALGVAAAAAMPLVWPRPRPS